MAKFEQASVATEVIFDEVRSATTIPHWVEFKVLCNNKQKEICKAIKANELVELLTEGLNVVFVINEERFDELPIDMKKLAIDEELALVSISETDTVGINKHDFNTSTGVLKKYGDAKVITLHESIKSLYDAAKEREEQEKAQRKGKRGRKPKE